jgi:hypothetical protein
MNRLSGLGSVLPASLIAGCGTTAAEVAPQEHTPAPARSTPAPHSDDYHHYYGAEAITAPVGDQHIDVEIEYHQPPRPAKTEAGKSIVLTATNIGVRLKVKLEKIGVVGRYTAVHLSLENTGMTVHDDAFRIATLSYDNGRTVAVKATKLACSKGFDDVVRLDVARHRTGCLAFPDPRTPSRSGSSSPWRTFRSPPAGSGP